MGFSFKGLTSGALVANNAAAHRAGHIDVADVPESYAGHTSSEIPHPDEKLGASRSSDLNASDEELNKVDTTAPEGVQKVQAVTFVWTKSEIIMGYVL